MIKRSIAIGVLVAVVLSFARGGITDSSTVLVAFALCGFFASLVVCWLSRADAIRTVDKALGHLPQSGYLRIGMSVLLAVSLLWWSGPFIRSGGYGGWLLAILLCLFAPLVICITAPRFSIAFGVFTATCITCSLLVSQSRWEVEHGNSGFWADFWNDEAGSYVVIWFVATVLSLLVSVPIQLWRRNSRKGVATPDTAAQLPSSQLPRSRPPLQKVALVVVPLLMLFGAMSLDGRLDRLRREYLEKRNYHNSVVVELVEAEHGQPITTLPELEKLEKVYASTSPAISRHRDLREKYWKDPWLSVPPDTWSEEQR